VQNLLYEDPGSFETSVDNLYIAAKPIIENIVGHWSDVFAKGINSSQYYGDVWGTLGGTPNFGPGRESGGTPVPLPEPPPPPGGASKRRVKRRMPWQGA
jgi:hypothetical protein